MWFVNRYASREVYQPRLRACVLFSSTSRACVWRLTDARNNYTKYNSICVVFNLTAVSRVLIFLFSPIHQLHQFHGVFPVPTYKTQLKLRNAHSSNLFVSSFIHSANKNKLQFLQVSNFTRPNSFYMIYNRGIFFIVLDYARVISIRPNYF